MAALDPWPYPFWIAHRGAGKLAPENTLAAFRLGAQHGYRMFECDAKLSQDDVVFLLHDATLDRTTSGLGTAGENDWQTLSQLDAGAWHSPTYAGEPITTLSALASFCLANGLLLDIEIKPTPGLERKTGERVAREAQRLWRSSSVQPLLTSFQTEALQGALAVAPELPRGFLLDSWHEHVWETVQLLKCHALICNHALWSIERVQHAKHLGLRTLSYTVNDEESVARLVSMGTDGIVTDRVDLFDPSRS